MQATTSNERPYVGFAGELVADAVALFAKVVQQRPEIRQLSGTLHITLDAAAGTILVALVQSDNKAVIVERILADPNEPDRFGASELPVCVVRDASKPH